MIDFRIADPLANSRFAHRIAFPSFTDQLLVLQASNSLMISRARARAHTYKAAAAPQYPIEIPNARPVYSCRAYIKLSAGKVPDSACPP
jgi:hypothetical protein